MKLKIAPQRCTSTPKVRGSFAPQGKIKIHGLAVAYLESLAKQVIHLILAFAQVPCS